MFVSGSCSGQMAKSSSSSSQLELGRQISGSETKTMTSCKKALRSKRCKSLLLLSSPFSGSSSLNVKSSLLSLLSVQPAPDPQLISSFNCQSSEKEQSAGKRTKSVKMKLFEQPLERLISPKAMKQLNQAIMKQVDEKQSKEHQQQQHQQQQQHRLSLGSVCKRRQRVRQTLSSPASLIREFSLAEDANNNTNELGQRQKLMLGCLPEPIRNLLGELNSRGPATVGIFRKSPNAKHCKELRQKLEMDSQSCVGHFQVSVIASVFKEWLRSLPDCLLMSRLYPQWIDVAKLIEPLQQQPALDCEDGTMRTCSSSSSSSPLTDNERSIRLDKTRSCSLELSISEPSKLISASPLASVKMVRKCLDEQRREGSRMTSARAIAERRSQCLRIVGQLLDSLNESNLILLRAFVCVLWRIANNSEFNKMSASNLGVCVGQSLLNDEQGGGLGAKSISGTGGSTFARRHRRTNSHSLLSSTLSLSYLDTTGAQETAKYVPMLIAFIIENAIELFGRDIATMFACSSLECRNETAIRTETSFGSEPSEEKLQLQVGEENVGADANDANKQMHQISRTQKLAEPTRRILVASESYKCDPNSNQQVELADDMAGNTTSILIINRNSAGKKPKRDLRDQEQLHQRRPLSATESTASSSTSGVHSESPAFSSELDSRNTNTSASSPAPSTLSSPTSSSSSPNCSSSHSPVENGSNDELDGQLDELARSKKQTISSAPTISANAEAARPSLLTQYRPAKGTPTPNARYGTFMGVLSRVPKIPVQFATSSYGGEAVIYNPRPPCSSSANSLAGIKNFVDSNGGGRENANANAKENLDKYSTIVPASALGGRLAMQQQENSEISVKPLDLFADRSRYSAPMNLRTSQQHQQELREHRLNDFLAHQHHFHHRPLISAPSLPYLAPNLNAPNQQTANFQTLPVNVRRPPLIGQQPLNNNANAGQHHQRLGRLQERHQHQQQQPIFYSTSNLSSLQLQRQQDGYLMYQFVPERSRVMTLRDYYLSLQQQNACQINRLQQRPPQTGLLFGPKLHSSSQQQQQQQCLIAQTQYLAAAGGQPNVTLTTQPTIQMAQPRMGKIRAGQFNGIYVKAVASVADETVQTAKAAKVAPKISSASEHSSDESDESISDHWMESTLV